jgi:hypothetical protein
MDLGDHLRQAVIGLRPDDQIHHRRPAQDLLALGLRHAARDADLHPGFRGLQSPQSAKVGIQLLRRLLADVAGVQKHHVRLFHHIGRDIALRAQGLGHALAVIDVHLAAVGLDEKLLHIGHAGRTIGE